MPADYPWYSCVAGDEIQQGDIIPNCPIYQPPDALADDDVADVEFQWDVSDVIVLSQSCDLVKGREKLENAIVCTLWRLSDFGAHHFLATPKGREDARRGLLPGYHLIHQCSIEDIKEDIRIVAFKDLHVLPVSLLRRRVEKLKTRARLMPPYREHLSQAFARFFMRVGLPNDIPEFRK